MKKKSNKVICVVFLLIVLINCCKNNAKESIFLVYDSQGILIKNADKEYIKIPYKIDLQNKNEKPAYCIDSNKNQIFVCVPFFGIKCFDLSNKALVHEQMLEYKYFKRNHSFNMQIINNYVVFSSYLEVLIFNKNLQLLADIRDTIETNMSPELALHKYDVEFSKDTLLFKAMFVERSDFMKNKRYKRIFKDYEFILDTKKIECKNCDKFKEKDDLTKEQYKELLSSPR